MSCTPRQHILRCCASRATPSSSLSLRRSEERCLDDGARITAPEVHSYLSRVMYGRRNKMNPLWNSVLVGGVDKAGARWAGRVGQARGAAVSGQMGARLLSPAVAHPSPHPLGPLWGPPPPRSYVGYVDLYGTAFADDFAATGFGTHVALPIIRERWRAGLSEGEARAVLEDCVRVLWYRDTRALNKITLAKVGRRRRGASRGKARGRTRLTCCLLPPPAR